MEQIVSRDTMRARGRNAFNAGRSRDSHGMNPCAAALADWHQGYDQAAQDWLRVARPQAEVIVAGACPP
jgi:hypothetical protein